MSTRVMIRRGEARDVAHVAELFARYREFYGKAAGDAERCGVFLHERLARGESVVFVAARGEELVGFAQLYPTFTSVGLARVWHLNDLYVGESARRAGVGRALVLRSIEFAKQDGAARLTLETQHTNAGARALYEKLGFVLGSEYVKYAMRMDA